jgi:hypothetical protein
MPTLIMRLCAEKSVVGMGVSCFFNWGQMKKLVKAKVYDFIVVNVSVFHCGGLIIFLCV